VKKFHSFIHLRRPREATAMRRIHWLSVSERVRGDQTVCLNISLSPLSWFGLCLSRLSSPTYV